MCIRDRNSILKLVLSGIPQEVGNLQQLIYKVETGPGMSKSLSLNVTGVTFSDALDTFTAYLSFDPIVTKIAANGEVRITLFGEQPYHWIATITGGKNYTAGNRYTGTAVSYTHLDRWNLKGIGFWLFQLPKGLLSRPEMRQAPHR